MAELQPWTEFELQPRYNVHIRTHTIGIGMNFLNPLANTSLNKSRA